MNQLRLCLIILLSFLFFTKDIHAQDDSLYKWKKLFNTSKDLKVQARNCFKIGRYYNDSKTNFDSSMLYLNLALEKNIKLDHKNGIGRTYYTIGINHAYANDKKKALENFSLAEKYAYELNDTTFIINAVQAKNYALEPKEQLVQLKKILLLATPGSHTRLRARLTILGNMARAFSSINELDSSLFYSALRLKQSASLPDSTKLLGDRKKQLQGGVYYHTGTVFKKQKRYKEAQKALLTSYEYYDSIDKGFLGKSNPLSGLVELANNWQEENPDEFLQNMGDVDLLKLLKESDQIALKSKSAVSNMDNIKAYLNYYKRRNNLDSVVKYQDKLLVMKDSFNREEQVEASAKFAEELKTADKEKEIIKLNADKKIASATANRNKIIFFLILLGLISSIYFIIKRIKYRNLKEQEERDKKFRTKLSSDLHDDVGTILTSLSMQSELLEMKTTDGNKGTVGKIASMSRDATRRMRDTVWAIDSRKDNAMDLAYRMIDFAEDMLGAKDVAFQLEHNIAGKEDKLSAELRQTIFLIFKEAITNAAKYGTGELVTTSLQKEKDGLKISIQNETEQEINIDEVSGLGLSNIKKRVTDIGGELNLKQSDNTFVIDLVFPA